MALRNLLSLNIKNINLYNNHLFINNIISNRIFTFIKRQFNTSEINYIKECMYEEFLANCKIRANGHGM